MCSMKSNVLYLVVNARQDKCHTKVSLLSLRVSLNEITSAIITKLNEK